MHIPTKDRLTHKTTKTIFLTISIPLLIISLTSCSSLLNKPDAITKATSKYKQGEQALPPALGEYKVLGIQKGLKKYVIQYDKNLFRGGAPYDDSASEALNKWGVKTIISIIPCDKERSFCKKFGYKLVEITFEKTKGPSKSDIDLLLATVNNDPGPFYLHCHGGTHRGGTLGVAYRMHKLGWTYDKALIEYGRLGGDLMADNIMLEAVCNYTKK